MADKKPTYEELEKQVAELREKEAQLHALEKKWDAVIDNSFDYLLVINKDGRIEDLNRVVPGFVKDQIIGMNVFDFALPEYTKMIRDSLDIAFSKGDAVFDEPAVDIMGSKKWFSARLIPLETSGDNPTAILIGSDITERKMAEKALIESRELVRSYINIPDGMIILMDSNHKILDANSVLAERIGKPLEELIGTCVWDLLPPEIAESRKKVQDTVLETGKVARHEDQREGKWLDNIVYPIFDEKGNVTRVAVYSQDITKRKEIEEALEKEKAFSNAILDAITDTVYVFDPETGQPIRWNKAMCEVSGYTDEEIGSMEAIKHWYSPEDQEKANENLKQVLNGKKETFEISLIRKDGSTVPTEYSATLLKAGADNENKKIIVAVGRDITERRKAEEAIVKSESRYRSLFMDSPICLWEENFSEVKKQFDRLGKSGVTDFRKYFDENPVDVMKFAGMVEILDINKSVLDLYKADNKESFVKNLHEIFTEESTVAFKELLIAMANGERTFDIEGVNVTLEGERKEQYIKYHIPASYKETLEKVYVSIIDFTEKKKGERELKKHREHLEELVKQRTRKLEEANEQLVHAQKMEAIGSLAGGMAHEFNNVMATISGTSELLVRSTPEESKENRLAERILKSSKRAKDLTSKLLTFARKEKLNIITTPVNELITDVMDVLNGTITKKVKIAAELDKSTECFITADVNQITQALLNICLNACDAMPDGGNITITTDHVKASQIKAGAGTKHGSYCSIRIKDTGPGIDPEIKDKIFNPFFTTKERGKGSGLGLSISHGIIESHDGIIEVESGDQEGTTFRILLPLGKSKNQTKSESTPENFAHTSSGRILVIDDDLDFLQTTQDILEMDGFHVIGANSGKEGIKDYKNHKDEIDLVMLDLMMPEMDGSEVFHALKEFDPDIKIVLCSGYSVEGTATNLMSEGACAYIQKPFQISDLSEVFDDIIRE